MRITELLHKEKMSTAKRLAGKSAWIAYIHIDGMVKLSHARHEAIHLSSRDELNQWITSNGMNDFDVLIVDFVNASTRPILSNGLVCFNFFEALRKRI